MLRNKTRFGAGLPPHLGGVANSAAQQQNDPPAAKNSSEALDECMKQIPEGVKYFAGDGEAPGNWKIEDAWIVERRKTEFDAKFERTWKEPSKKTGKVGPERWQEDRRDVLEAAFLIGVYSRRIAMELEHEQITKEDFDAAVDRVIGPCREFAKGRPSLVWCA